MSGKLSEVEGRIGTVHQLEAVITAMASAPMPRRSAQRSVRRLLSLRNPSRNRAKTNTRKDT